MKTIAALACLSLAAVPATADLEGVVERPLPPMALTVESAPSGNMLSWQPPLPGPGAPVEVYNVYRIVDDAVQALGSVSAAQTSYFDGAVEAVTGTSYLYYVTAQSDAGESMPSNVAANQYPWCTNVVIFGPDIEINTNCILPLPTAVAVILG